MWCPVEEEAGPVLALAWLLGSTVNLSSLAGFCTFFAWSHRSLLGVTVQLIHPTLEFSREYVPHQDPTPSLPTSFGRLSKRQYLVMPFSIHPVPGKCALFVVASDWVNLKETGNNTPTPKLHSEAEMLTGMQSCSKHTSQNSLRIWLTVSCFRRNCCFNGLDHYPSLSLGDNRVWQCISCMSGFMYNFRVLSHCGPRV